ncbi:SRPBCC domain-containing protein [Sphingobium sp. DEHP117]|uniref:SRPBCC domain-containing protein n=1 Tax=Sphingobium sp. DEHP117 TaxID=2993436 RepID=UPI0027D48853|nr:SRPBCC domain-containing protein [Sphingobium sp. DEHP117]MDQ4421376.1 SRPBCC domain-containing protein [Sphingobium sp. DEHP117]
MNDAVNALSVEILIDAPPEKVWDAMTRRQAEWWCPRPWRTEIIAQEWRAGGRCAMVMRGPNAGEEHASEGIFLEVTPGVRFVTTDCVSTVTGAGDWTPQQPFMIGIWELIPEGGATRYRASARHWSAEARKQHEDMGFVEGWQACARQLKELVETA